MREKFSRLIAGIILPTILLFSVAFAKTMNTWPHKIPCRIKNGRNPNLLIATLGNVHTKLAQGIFDPEKDLVILNDGTRIKDYYKKRLGIKYYQPIDKVHFPLPPSGWCSWYYYYLEVSADEVKKNAKWMAENLEKYGAKYIQIDDGWEGKGHGYGDNRDWTTVDTRFPEGMDGIARYIRSLGLTPGLWLAPHGQSNPAVVKKWNTFLLKKDGTSASKTWEGDYLLDPTAPKADAYLKDLFTRLCNWEYEYFKIDGQPIVIREYKAKKKYMRNPGKEPIKLYRHTIKVIKKTIGPDRYLLGCWGIPLEGVGIMNGSRTGGDIYPDWNYGFMTALDATMKFYYLHNIAWYCDPDVMCVRYPLTLGMARAWATLQGLSGETLMDSDRLMDLSPERVEILKRVFPAVDIRPLDLFPAKRNKSIWDLKINHLGRNYDVVGCFNYDPDKSNIVYLNWQDLGLPSDTRVHVYDFWGKEYLGCWKKGYFVHLTPASVKVLTLVVAGDEPQLISTSRHITQGWVDLIACNYNAATDTYSGESQVVGGDPYEIRFAFPPGKNYRIKKAVAENLETTINNHQGWASFQFTSPNSNRINWQVTFEPAKSYHFPVAAPGNINYKPVSLNSLRIVWSPTSYSNAGYYVYCNKKLLGVTPVNNVVLRHIDLSSKLTIEVSSAWYDGSESEKKASVSISPDNVYSDEIYLSDIEPDLATAGWGGAPKSDKSIAGGELEIGDKFYSKGIGTHAVSDIVYSLKGKYKIFTAFVGLDGYSAANKKGTVDFKVFGDNKLLWESGIIKYSDPPKLVRVDISRVNLLRLHVGDAGDGIDYDHADWGNAKIMR